MNDILEKSSFIPTLFYLLLDVLRLQWCLNQNFIKYYRNQQNLFNCHYENATGQIVFALKISKTVVMISPLSAQYFGFWDWTCVNIDLFPCLYHPLLFALGPLQWSYEISSLFSFSIKIFQFIPTYRTGIMCLKVHNEGICCFFHYLHHSDACIV